MTVNFYASFVKAPYTMRLFCWKPLFSAKEPYFCWKGLLSKRFLLKRSRNVRGLPVVVTLQHDLTIELTFGKEKGFIWCVSHSARGETETWQMKSLLIVAAAIPRYNITLELTRKKKTFYQMREPFSECDKQNCRWIKICLRRRHPAPPPLYPTPWTLNPTPETRIPKPETLNMKP